ncbi:MAG: DNA cytosine methyltransferase [Novosphingobium sp.]|nr:DNA cytosine methyltransferase [Novosphingobium sp.]
MNLIKSLNAVELFAGAGGLGIGLKNAGVNIVLANEIDKIFSDTFKYNNPETKVICEDISRIDFKNELKILGIDSIHIVSGGPPCQGFSTVGNKNENDPRNKLFYEFLRAVSEINPYYVIFENVSGFKNLYNGKAHEILIKNLSDLGFETVSAILDASDYGLPQIRKRTIVLGWKRFLQSVSLPKVKYSNKNNSLFGMIPKLSIMDAISDLPPLESNDSKDYYLLEPKNNYQSKLRGNQLILTEHNSSNYGVKMKKILSLVPEGGTVNDLPVNLRPKKYFNNTYSRLLPDKPAPTITRNFGTPSSSRCIHPYQNRALSTREGARLQGFPDDYVFLGSKTTKNLQIGNAVSPIFGKIIAEEIIKSHQNSFDKECQIYCKLI